VRLIVFTDYVTINKSYIRPKHSRNQLILSGRCKMIVTCCCIPNNMFMKISGGNSSVALRGPKKNSVATAARNGQGTLRSASFETGQLAENNDKPHDLTCYEVGFQPHGVSLFGANRHRHLLLVLHCSSNGPVSSSQSPDSNSNCVTMGPVWNFQYGGSEKRNKQRSTGFSLPQEHTKGR